MTETQAREALVRYGRSLFARGYSCGTSGNLSVRLEAGGYLMSPTNISLGQLDPGCLSTLDSKGVHVDGPVPTKEAWLHLAMYRSRPDDSAVVHLHSTYATALSCLSDRPDDDVLPAMTPYVVMRVGRVARVPYARPGDHTLSATISSLAIAHRAVLLANHGPVVSGASLDAAVAAAEELEETAKLFFVLGDRPHRLLDAEQIDELRRVFGS
ncbi:MAG: aldolase [Acidobacteria bacterium]|nr:MAG: aldolase [Acidobacteriota bacterium]